MDTKQKLETQNLNLQVQVRRCIFVLHLFGSENFYNTIADNQVSDYKIENTYCRCADVGQGRCVNFQLRLLDAKSARNGLSDCIGVYDRQCTGDSEPLNRLATICVVGNTFEKSTDGSCVYKKI